MHERWKAWLVGFRAGRAAGQQGLGMRQCPYDRSDPHRKGFRKGIRFEAHLREERRRQAESEMSFRDQQRAQFAAQMAARQAEESRQEALRAEQQARSAQRDLMRVYGSR